MSLPGTPRTRLGLPMSPRPNTPNTTGSYPEILSRPSSAAGDRPRLRTNSPPSPVPSQLNPQRTPSTPSLSSQLSLRSSKRGWQAGAPPVPPLPIGVARDRDELRVRRHMDKNITVPPVISPVQSSSSTASSVSSFNSPRSSLGSASSVTSVEDIGQPDVGDDKVAPGFGTSLWNRAALIAGNLSVSVSRAWGAAAETMDGERTPPGEESRLTRAMKAYHIGKARDPSDLPEWLFSESERGLNRRIIAKDIYSHSGTQEVSKPARPNMNTPSRSYTAPPSGKDAMTKTMQRLVASRSVKRDARVRFADAEHPRQTTSESDDKRSLDPPTVIPPVGRPPLGVPPTRVLTLPNVNARGEKLVGLPQSVRPQRRPTQL